jgi:Tol biopolymer transport system component
MSPEQAAGKPVDRRSDLWAFGVVLLEMLTGRPVFDGETVPQVLASVLKDEPDWNALPATAPAPTRRLLRRCLEKDRRRRLTDASDARLEIEDSLATPAAEVPPTNVSNASRSALTAPRARVASAIAVAAVLVAAVLAVPAARYLRMPPSAAPPEMRLEINTPATTDPLSFKLSPDGKQIVYAASGGGGARLWLRSLATTTAQPLAGTEGALYPFWSPDSKSIGFFASGQLKRLDLDGGQPQVVVSAAGSGRGGTWNDEDVIVFSPTAGSALFRVAATGGELTAVTTLDKQQSHRFPRFLPGGRQFLFSVLGPPETQGIYLGSLDARDTRRLTAADTGGAYLAPGWLVWIQGGTLRAQRLHLEQGQLTGDPVTLADPVAYDPSVYAGGFSVSDSGMLAYRSGAGGQRRQLAWVDRAGKALGLLGAPDENNMLVPRVSPDGRRVAVFRTVQGNTDIWLLDGARTSRFTFDAALDQYQVWSPDGTRIAFDSNRTGVRDLYIKPAGGVGAEERLVESAQVKMANHWSRDGRFLLFHSIDPQSGRDLWVVPLDGDRKPWVFLKTTFEERLANLSPDGRWVAYESNESGRDEIYVRSFVEGGSGAGGGQWQVSTAGGIHPIWRPDGQELYYARRVVFGAHRFRWRGRRPRPAVRRCPRRPLPDQHGL